MQLTVHVTHLRGQNTVREVIFLGGRPVLSEVYLGPFQASTMEMFAKND